MAGRPGPKSLKRLDGVLIKRLGITICQAEDLLRLSSWEIVAIVDDSGSMSRRAVPREKRKPGVEYPTRWDELRETLKALVDIAVCLDGDGVDLHFLNLGSVMGVTSINDARLQQVLAKGPQSGTPLTETVQRVLQGFDRSKLHLVVILTDGEPNGGREPFKSVVRNAILSTTTRFQVMACTGDDEEVAWLNELDEEFEELDVTDDYRTEREEVMRTKRYRDFTRADWVIKALLGPLDARFDALDEIGNTEQAAPPTSAEHRAEEIAGLPEADQAGDVVVESVPQQNLCGEGCAIA